MLEYQLDLDAEISQAVHDRRARPDTAEGWMRAAEEELAVRSSSNLSGSLAVLTVFFFSGGATAGRYLINIITLFYTFVELQHNFLKFASILVFIGGGSTFFPAYFRSWLCM